MDNNIIVTSSKQIIQQQQILKIIKLIFPRIGNDMGSYIKNFYINIIAFEQKWQTEIVNQIQNFIANESEQKPNQPNAIFQLYEDIGLDNVINAWLLSICFSENYYCELVKNEILLKIITKFYLSQTLEYLSKIEMFNNFLKPINNFEQRLTVLKILLPEAIITAKENMIKIKQYMIKLETKFQGIARYFTNEVANTENSKLLEIIFNQELWKIYVANIDNDNSPNKLYADLLMILEVQIALDEFYHSNSEFFDRDFSAKIVNGNNSELLVTKLSNSLC